MEEVFQARFSDVRVHVGAEASAIGALSYTTGSHIYFAHGQYDPTIPRGQRLLAHELTHVLQQRSGRVGPPRGSAVLVVEDPALESEAQRMGERAVAALNRTAQGMTWPGPGAAKGPQHGAAGARARPAPSPIHVVERAVTVQGHFVGAGPRIPGPHPPETRIQGGPHAAAGRVHRLPADFRLWDRPGGGRPLPGLIQQRMESALGASFSDVRVHTTPRPVIIGAQALTHGRDIYVTPEHWNLNRPAGVHLLGHELAHVLQQRAGRVSNPFRSGIAIVQNRGLDAEASRLGNRAVGVMQPFFGILGLAALGGAGGYAWAGATATWATTALWTGGGMLAGGLTGWGLETAYSAWYGPQVAIVTITGFDINSSYLPLLSEDDLVIKGNYNRLRRRFPWAKVIHTSDMDENPLSVRDLAGVRTLYIIGHGDDTIAEVGGLSVEDLFKKIGKDFVRTAGAGGGSTAERKTRLTALWQISDINLVSCNSSSSRHGAQNIASQLRAKFAGLSTMIGKPIRVRGVDGYATVSATGEVLRVAREHYPAWTHALRGLRSDVTSERRRGTPLSLSEVERRNRAILDRYSSGAVAGF